MSNGYIGTAPIAKASESSYTTQLVTASNTISVPGGYVQGGVHIHVNGLYIPDTEYIAADGMNIVFPSVLPKTTIVTVRSIDSFKVANLSPSNNAVIAILSSNLFLKEDSSKPMFSKATNTTLITNQRLICTVLGVALSVPSGSTVTMPTLTAGNDYAIYLEPSGSLKAKLDSFTSPSTPTAVNAIKIGGFHYGLVADGTTPASGGFNNITGVTGSGGSMLWTQTDVDKIAGINTFSLWDKAFRCKGEQRGMALDPQTGVWWAIYFCGTEHITQGISAYNTDIASGTVLPKIPIAYGGNDILKYSRFSLYEMLEVLVSHGHRAPTYEEACSAFFGVTEGQSLGGAASTVPATLRQPGYTSRIGIEQATGHQFILGGPFSSVGGTAYDDVGRGSFYGTLGLALLGGYRSGVSISGSRCGGFNYAPSVSDWSFSLRAAGDHLQGIA